MKKITIEHKILLNEDTRKLLSDKENRNKLISVGIGVAASLIGLVVDKCLEKKLIEEFAPEFTEEETIEGEVIN